MQIGWKTKKYLTWQAELESKSKEIRDKQHKAVLARQRSCKHETVFKGDWRFATGSDKSPYVCTACGMLELAHLPLRFAYHSIRLDNAVIREMIAPYQLYKTGWHVYDETLA